VHHHGVVLSGQQNARSTKKNRRSIHGVGFAPCGSAHFGQAVLTKSARLLSGLRCHPARSPPAARPVDPYPAPPHHRTCHSEHRYRAAPVAFGARCPVAQPHITCLSPSPLAFRSAANRIDRGRVFEPVVLARIKTDAIVHIRGLQRLLSSPSLA